MVYSQIYRTFLDNQIGDFAGLLGLVRHCAETEPLLVVPTRANLSSSDVRLSSLGPL